MSVQTILQPLPHVRPPLPEDAAAQALLPFTARFRHPRFFEAHRDPFKLLAVSLPEPAPGTRRRTQKVRPILR
jgi:hypothetical protein